MNNVSVNLGVKLTLNRRQLRPFLSNFLRLIHQEKKQIFRNGIRTPVSQSVSWLIIKNNSNSSSSNGERLLNLINSRRCNGSFSLYTKSCAAMATSLAWILSSTTISPELLTLDNSKSIVIWCWIRSYKTRLEEPMTSSAFTIIFNIISVLVH